MTEESRNNPAATLRQTLQAPIYNRTLRKHVGAGELDYEVYLQTRALVALQTPLDRLVVPDEMVFQVLHQTQELWLKCVSFEAVSLVRTLDADEPFGASATLDRMVAVTRCLARDIEVLFTLPPDVFQIIRRHLGNGSGLESPGYNQVLVAADAVGAAFDRKVSRSGVDLLDVYTDRPRYAELHRLAEQMCDWDGAFQGWLMAHFVLVRRTIGVDRSVRALDGFPTTALPARMTKPLFPRLWDLRVEMTSRWTREGGYAPGDRRTSAVVPRAEPNEPDVAIKREAE
jgi:tryptophan 2,3-dioxygenase